MHGPFRQWQSRAWRIGGVLWGSLWLLGALAFAAGGESLYDTMIADTAQQHGFEPAFVKAVIKCESGFNPLAVSPRGAQGLMQLMPATQAFLGVSNAFTPRENIAAGVRYLAMLRQLFPGNTSLVMAAYNAGPQAVLDAGSAVPPFPETRRYVQCVSAAWQRYRQPGLPAPTPGEPFAPVVPLITATDQALQVKPLRFSQPIARVGHQVTVSMEAVQAGPQSLHGVVMLMYPEQLVSYAMLSTTGNETMVRMPGSAADGHIGKASWVTNTFQILQSDWPEWRPGQPRTLAFALVPRVAQEITMHLSVFLSRSAGLPAQPRWSTVVRLPVHASP